MSVNHKLGRTVMHLQILVMGVMKQGLGCNFDRLHKLVNVHKYVPLFLSYSDVFESKGFTYQSVVDKVTLLTPEVLVEVSKPVNESGHGVSKKS